MSEEWFVEIVAYKDEKVERSIGPYGSERQAERADDGVNINLNHADFYTRVVRKP